MKLSNKKVVISGNVIEVYTYDESSPVCANFQSKRNLTEPMEIKENQSRLDNSIYRSKRTLKRLINANAGFHFDHLGKPFLPVFLTLTFAENITNIKSANYEFTKFIQRLNYFIYGLKRNTLKYAVAIEFQTRGAIHYHVVFFNMPFVSKMNLAKIWRQGFIKIKSIKNVEDIGNYVTKYITKELFDKRLRGQKCYFTSRKLLKPVVIKDQEKADFFIGLLDDKDKRFERKVSPECRTPYKYEVYNVKNSGFIKSFVSLSYRHDFYNV